MNAPRWRNLTDHSITIIADGQRAVMMPDGQVARVEVEHPVMGYTAVGNIVVPIIGLHQKGVVGLPAYSRDVNLVVSQFVARAVGNTRPDVYCPGPLIKRPDGAIDGTRGLMFAGSFAGNAQPLR